MSVLVKSVVFLILIYVPFGTNSYFRGNNPYETTPSGLCPYMYPKQFTGYAPRGNQSAGIFTHIDYEHSLEGCLKTCCRNIKTCNVIFMHNTTCYHVQCSSDELCLPLSKPSLDQQSVLVLVRPVSDVTWTEYIENDPQISSHLDDLQGTDHYDVGDVQYSNDDMAADESGYENIPLPISAKKECVTTMNCRENEECVLDPKNINTKICICMPGFFMNTTGNCQRENEAIHEISTSKPAKKQLIVSALSKEVRLPESETTLSAFIAPTSDQPYTYEWKLLTRPKNSEGTMILDKNGATIRLTHLTEGLYTFRVTVSNADSFGETLANVTVLPPKRINKPPIVKITPLTQIVRLPTTGAVLDGSGSSDDDGIKSWHWELHRGPLEYSPHLPDTAMLQLTDLKIPGNYTFKLTVTDTDGATNSTTANITVMKLTDYPPIANAGQDAIIYLPNNELTLNGNLSTDDHEITSWEWTKGPSDANKAVDMQNTRSPYLKLSHLEEGYYTFVLRVTDSAGQSNSAEVHVFVKQASHKPPEAHAGVNQTINLPQTWTILDGSSSSEHILQYHWESLSGPSNVFIQNANASKTNVTNLTRGQYVFRLTVTDDSGNAATDLVVVNVTQVKNERPKANAGGDRTIELPQTLVILNGSGSHDDVGIAVWQWTRDDISLAIGNILGNSDRTAELMLGDLEPGRYVFRLKVFDEDGLSDEDTASVMVKPDPMLVNEVELTLGAQARTLTQSQIKGVMQELGLLVRDEATLTVRMIRTEQPGGRAVVSLTAHQANGSPTAENKVLTAIELERLLKDKLYRDSSLLRLSVASLRTTICQNNCSSHGVCDEHTRRCLCEAFWMQNLFEKYFGRGEADCEWSVLYVVVGLCSAGLCVTGFIWGIAFLCSRACQQRRVRTSNQRPPKYALLEDDDQSNFSGQKMVISESDTDSDVLFESRSKNGRKELVGNGFYQNGGNRLNKLGRRIKT
ncbi:dyslexia-associated protein KIAA0319-like protein [Chrysoperla carnea]|uniref:dyslexia-associated protein KIAA0319-like protein n=1 Tax=Chrysoperla carnea TaxID=189513 RepID=UPI001D085A5A|nr:dyslexia-associated protein KIAA0319-like protein [Chrysoperla carnea]